MHTRTSLPRRLATAGSFVLAPLLLGGWTHPAARTQSALDQAIHNTNSVRTLVHTDTLVLREPSETVTIAARGEEDEVRNRERDQESVTVVLSGKKPRKLRYTLHLIFMNGKTYFQASQLGKAWHTRKGMSFPDAFVVWARGRTTVKLPQSPHFTPVGTVSGGLQHVHSPYKTGTSTGTVDLWYSTGRTPYVVKEGVTARSTAPGRKATTVETISFGPFNRTLVIEPPSSGGGSA